MQYRFIISVTMCEALMGCGQQKTSEISQNFLKTFPKFIGLFRLSLQ